ncbi:MAG: hypothetical protein KC593_23250 [Myxococcales bacterium]|nr:hypothetical protein [Myxococcales bacterium]MCB9628129.1 hypothetical protein [Sandaracinaceae bacterium]
MSDQKRDDKATRPPGRQRAPSTPPTAPRPGRYVPPAPGGVAAAAPSTPLPLDASSQGDALGQRERGRVTINFSGPPLELPGLSQMAPPQAPAAPARVAPMPSDDEHDAWVTERKRRSTLPPSASLGVAAALPPRQAAAAGPALQHKWMSAHQAPLRHDSASIALPEPDSAGHALDLADRGRPSETGIDLMAEVRARYALDDLTGALQMAEIVLGSDESNAEAKQFAVTCRQRLELLYTSQLGPLDAVPRIDVPETDIRWLGLDHRAGFMLSRVDGLTSLEELLDLSGMERLEALKTVVSLVDAGAIAIPR